MSDSFEQYEQQYSRHSSAASRRLRSLGTFGGDPRRLEIISIEKELDSADRYLSQMESDARSAITNRSKMEGRIRTFRQELEGLRAQVQRAKTEGSSSMRGYGSVEDPDAEQAAYRQRLLQVEQRNEQTLGRMDGTIAVSAENEQIGADVLHELHRNRAQLIGTYERLADIEENTVLGSKFVGQMTWRAYQHKAILIAIDLLLLGLLGVILYFAFRPSK